MMIEMPLPIPFSVINSPIQTSSIVPAVIDASTAIVDRAVSGLKRPKPSRSVPPVGLGWFENRTP
jgi:hypothetical protein